MKVDLSNMIGGQSMLVIRKFLRQAGTANWGVSYVQRVFDFSESEAKELVGVMAEKGYVKKSDYAISGSWWEVAAAGRRIALANATKRIRREAADRMVSALLQRVNEVNSSNYYLFRVAKVIAFGSYVDEESHIGEIDVEIQLEPKEPDKGKHFHAIEQRAGKERSKGRRFGTHAEELDSGELEVLLYLKSRSRYLSFIHISPEWQKKLPCRILFDAES